MAPRIPCQPSLSRAPLHAGGANDLPFPVLPSAAPTGPPQVDAHSIATVPTSNLSSPPADDSPPDDCSAASLVDMMDTNPTFALLGANSLLVNNIPHRPSSPPSHISSDLFHPPTPPPTTFSNLQPSSVLHLSHLATSSSPPPSPLQGHLDAGSQATTTSNPNIIRDYQCYDASFPCPV